jgi:hypothetical protein
MVSSAAQSHLGFDRSQVAAVCCFCLSSSCCHNGLLNDVFVSDACIVLESC